MDYYITAYKEAKPLSDDLFAEDSRHHMAKTHPRHRSFDSRFSSQRLHHLDAISASLGRSCCPHERSPPRKKQLFGELSRGKHNQGGLKKRFNDPLKVSKKSFSVTPNSLDYVAQEWEKWREVVKRGTKVCEARRNAATELLRTLRKGTATSAAAAIIPCSHCSRLFRLEIGLIIRAYTDPVHNHKVNQMVLID